MNRRAMGQKAWLIRGKAISWSMRNVYNSAELGKVESLDSVVGDCFTSGNTSVAASLLRIRCIWIASNEVESSK